MIEKESATKFLNIIKGWRDLFEEAPDVMVLTGNYQWTEGEEPATTGHYEKLTFAKVDVIRELEKLMDYATKVRDKDYVLLYFGI